MLTARAEFRLSLRSDTADDRYSTLAHDWALISSDRATSVRAERAVLDRAISAFAKTNVNPNGIEDRALQAQGQTRIAKPMSLAEVMRRPKLRLSDLREVAKDVVEPVIGAMPCHLMSRFEDELKYAAFVTREAREVARTESLCNQPLPVTEGSIPGVRYEALQQLHRHQPKTFGEAQRIAGITAADISALMIHATRMEHTSQ